MSRPIKQSRPQPTDWKTNSMAARGWGDPVAEAHHLWVAWSLTAGAIGLAAVYGAISWAFRNNHGGEL